MAALDLPDAGEALTLAREIAPFVGGFKIGKELFTASGPSLVREVVALERPVFLDLKFHDIPNTVAGGVRSAIRMGISMLTIHCCGGRNMMQAAEEAAQDEASRLGLPDVPLVLGVTVLTSMETSDLVEIGVSRPVGQQVELLAELAKSSGLRGLVCSPLEIVGLRQLIGPGMKLVTPGIRPGGQADGDQKRVLGPRDALQAGADWLVIGRPIYRAAKPAEAASQIQQELAADL